MMRMHYGRTALLALSLLSACAASGPAAPGEVQGQAGAFADYLVGRDAAQHGDLDTAADRLRATFARDPSNISVAQQAFLASLLAGRGDLTGLAGRLPGNSLAALYLADAHARAGEWDAAERGYATLPLEGLTDALRPLLVAWAEQGAGQTDAALARLKPLTHGPHFPGVYALHAGLIADQAGRAGDAAAYYRQALTDYGSLNLRLGLIVASAEARRGLDVQARQTLDETIRTNPELGIARPALEAALAKPAVPTAVDGIAEAYLAFAATLRSQGANDLAQVMLRLALLNWPGFTAARLLLADVQAQAGQPAAALATLSAVPAGDPLSAIVRLRRADLLNAAVEHQQAAEQLAALAQEFPDRPEPLAQEGEVLRSEERYADASTAYTGAIARAAALGQVPWTLYFERGVARERSSDWPGAQADLEQALKLAPDEPAILNYLAYSWAERDENLPQARQMLERAVAILPHDGAIIDSLGYVLLRQGDTAGAVRQLERAVEIDPEDPEINGHLGDAYLAAGRPREAGFQWERALTLKPSPKDQAQIEAKLNKLPAGTARAKP